MSKEDDKRRLIKDIISLEKIMFKQFEVYIPSSTGIMTLEKRIHNLANYLRDKFGEVSNEEILELIKNYKND